MQKGAARPLLFRRLRYSVIGRPQGPPLRGDRKEPHGSTGAKKHAIEKYDYSTLGAYFITICTKDKRCIFWDTDPSIAAIGADIIRPPYGAPPSYTLTAAGESVDQAIRGIQKAYPAVSVAKYVIMPNHVHMLLQISAGDDGRMISAPTISTVVGQMKRQVSKKLGMRVWQKSFYEHIIRNEDDYRMIAEYVDGNPAKWSEDRFYPP